MLSIESLPVFIALIGSTVSISLVIIQRAIVLKAQIKKLKEHETVPYEKHVKNYNKIKLRAV
jgi:hypothetical protein